MRELLPSFGLLLTGLLTVAAAPASVLLLALTAGAMIPIRRKSRNPAKKLHMVALIPAHDEEKHIARCVASLLAAGDRDDFEVWVVADNSSDLTPLVAFLAGASVLVRKDERRKGKGYALDFGFQKLMAAGVEAFLVIDADSVVSPNLVREMRACLEQGADAAQSRYRVKDPAFGFRRKLMDLALLGFNVLRPLGRDRLGLSAGLFGNGFALTSDTLRSVPYKADSVVEDLEYHIHLVRGGYRVRFVNSATVYGEIPTGVAASSQRSRWEGGRLRMAREWIPELVRDLARMRWRSSEPLADLMTLPLGYQALALTALLVVSPGPMKWLAIAQFGIIGLHVVVAASFGERFPWSLGVLGGVPFYVAWKLTLLTKIVRSSQPGAQWVRTRRS
jgi:cellulose synthase/poly-beta-1,6-N-acetylglucosamine synthase-like glycosyltransferase